jgi:hypothetical protein
MTPESELAAELTAAGVAPDEAALLAAEAFDPASSTTAGSVRRYYLNREDHLMADATRPRPIGPETEPWDLVMGDIERAFAEAGLTDDARATLATLEGRATVGPASRWALLGRDHLAAAIEELADAVCHLRLEMAATPGANGQVVAALYADVVRVLVGLHAVLNGRA